MNDLTATLAAIKKSIARSAYQSEADVRQMAQQVLAALEWDVFNPEHVINEYPVQLGSKTRRIDIALCTANRRPRGIIELKRPDSDLGPPGQSQADRQLFRYLFDAGAPVAVLTNGVTWRFYSTYSSGSYAERLVEALSLDSSTPEAAARTFERYLSFENTQSGKAADHVRDDLARRRVREALRNAIPEAWRSLVSGEVDERLIELLSSAVVHIHADRPEKRDLADFLRQLEPPKSRRSPKTTRQPPPKRRTVVPTDGKVLRYRLLGEEMTANTAKEAWIKIFEVLAKRESDLLARAAPRLKGRKNRTLGRSRQELSATESVNKTAVQLRDGWWLNVHWGNSAKIRQLQVLCDVAGIAFGDPEGLEIKLPNA